MEKKIYVICEDYTGQFGYLETDYEKAKKYAKENGCFILEYKLNQDGTIEEVLEED